MQCSLLSRRSLAADAESGFPGADLVFGDTAIVGPSSPSPQLWRNVENLFDEKRCMAVILSGEAASRSEAIAESKDPYQLGGCERAIGLKIEADISRIFGAPTRYMGPSAPRKVREANSPLRPG